MEEKKLTFGQEIAKLLSERVSNLLSVKSLVTVTLTAVFAYLAIKGTISGEQFLTIFTTIIAFYYGTQAKKE